MTLVGQGTIRLDWSPPFTWEGHPIIGYHVTSVNTSEPLGGTISTWSSNDTSFNHSWPHGDELLGSRCDVLVFSVTASSDIGESSKRNISSGFPISMFICTLRWQLFGGTFLLRILASEHFIHFTLLMVKCLRVLNVKC